MENYFEILGIKRGDDFEEVSKSFRSQRTRFRKGISKGKSTEDRKTAEDKCDLCAKIENIFTKVEDYEEYCNKLDSYLKNLTKDKEDSDKNKKKPKKLKNSSVSEKVEDLILEYQSHFNIGNFELSLPFLEKANILDPNNQNYLYKLAITFEKLGKFPEAYKYYRQSINCEESQSQLDIFCEAARFFYCHFPLKEVLPLYDRLLSFYPDNEIILNAKACTLIKINEFNDGLSILKNLNDSCPDDRFSNNIIWGTKKYIDMFPRNYDNNIVFSNETSLKFFILQLEDSLVYVDDEYITNNLVQAKYQLENKKIVWRKYIVILTLFNIYALIFSFTNFQIDLMIFSIVFLVLNSFALYNMKMYIYEENLRKKENIYTKVDIYNLFTKLILCLMIFPIGIPFFFFTTIKEVRKNGVPKFKI